VLGCYTGKLHHHIHSLNIRKFFLCALSAFAVCAFVKYGGYFNWVHDAKAALNLYPKKFPLNVYGLIYGVSFLCLFYASSLAIWESVKRNRLSGEIIPLFGRNSLVAFVIHAYFIYIIVIMQELALNKFAVLGLAVASFYLTYKIVSYIDNAKESGYLSRHYLWLFG